MADINKVILVGRLTRDAAQSYTQSGVALVKFSIAVNRRRKQNDQWVDEANFFDITSFGRQGEAIVNYLLKGRLVGIDGQLRQDRWEAQDGTRRSKVYIDANYIQLLGGRDNDAPRSRNQDGDAYQPKAVAPEPSSPGPESFPTNFEDDIPF